MRNNRGSGRQTTFAAEFTHGQLLIGSCVLLVVALVCFLLGILVGNYDPSLKMAEADKTDGAKIGIDAAAAKPTEKPKQGRGTQTSPRHVSLDTGTGVRQPSQPKPRSRTLAPPPPKTTAAKKDPPTAPYRIARTPEARVSPRGVRPSPTPNPAAQAPNTTEPATAAETPKTTEPVAAAKTAAASETPATEMATASPAIEEADLLDAAPMVETVVPVPAAAPEAPPASAQKPRQSGFRVQLSALDSQEKALAFQQELMRKRGLSTEVIAPTNDKYYRVVVTGYEDRSSAVAACAELKAAGFTDAWVPSAP